MFHFGGFPTHTYGFSVRSMALHHGSFLIRKSADRSLFAAPRGLSQLVTSFIGSWCQGIHLMLLFAWTSLACSQFLELLEFLNMVSQQKDFFPFCFDLTPPLGEIVWIRFFPNSLTLDWKDLSCAVFKSDTLTCLCPLYLFFLLNFALFDFQWSQNSASWVYEECLAVLTTASRKRDRHSSFPNVACGSTLRIDGIHTHHILYF